MTTSTILYAVFTNPYYLKLQQTKIHFTDFKVKKFVYHVIRKFRLSAIYKLHLEIT